MTHLVDCDGNCFVLCYYCGGDGWVLEYVDDLTEEEVPCTECDGRGGWACPEE